MVAAPPPGRRRSTPAPGYSRFPNRAPGARGRTDTLVAQRASCCYLTGFPLPQRQKGAGGSIRDAKPPGWLQYPEALVGLAVADRVVRPRAVAGDPLPGARAQLRRQFRAVEE